jgi:hypothetical protein
MKICKFCNSHQSPNQSGLTRHEKHCASNPNSVPTLPPWNKGLTGDPRCKHSDETKNKLKGGLGICLDPDSEIKRREKLKIIALRRKLGGYVQGSGRGKKGWYKGFFCDSSWELAYVVYCLEHGIDIKRNTEKRHYIWQGIIKNYIPDFIVEGNVTEVKGYKTKQWLAKLEANPDVKVLYEKDLKPVLEYVKTKYGKNFISLYE